MCDLVRDRLQVNGQSDFAFSGEAGAHIYNFDLAQEGAILQLRRSYHFAATIRLVPVCGCQPSWCYDALHGKLEIVFSPGCSPPPAQFSPRTYVHGRKLYQHQLYHDVLCPGLSPHGSCFPCVHCTYIEVGHQTVEDSYAPKNAMGLCRESVRRRPRLIGWFSEHLEYHE